MKKQLKITSTPLSFDVKLLAPTEPEKKVTLEQSFFERLREELKKYEYVTNNEYFKKHFDIEKIKTFSKAWDMYRKLKAKAHDVVQTGFELYKNCEKKVKDDKLEALIDTYNVIKEKELVQDKEVLPLISSPCTSSSSSTTQTTSSSTSSGKNSQVVWRSNSKKEQVKYDHQQINDIYTLLFFGLQLRSLCDWLYTNLNPQKTDASSEEENLRKQRHLYFNETIPNFIQKTKQKIYYSDLPNKDKKLVDKISLGYEPKSKN